MKETDAIKRLARVLKVTSRELTILVAVAIAGCGVLVALQDLEIVVLPRKVSLAVTGAASLITIVFAVRLALDAIDSHDRKHGNGE